MLTPSTDVPGPTIQRPSPGPEWPRSLSGRGVWSVFGRSMRAIFHLATFFRAGKAQGMGDDATNGKLDSMSWPSRPLRIGVMGGAGLEARLSGVPGAWQTEWVTLSVEDATPAAFKNHTLDAIVHHIGLDGIEVETPENEGMDAAWFDWAAPAPLSYPAVFPSRIDAAKVSMPDALRQDTRLVRCVIETAALLSRHPARLTVEDSTSGRRPFMTEKDHTPGGAGFDALGRAMQTLSAFLPFSTDSSVSRAASRVLGAYLTVATGWSDESRLASMEAVAAISGDEPQTMLRLAAVRLGMGQDKAGLDAISRADRMLRDSQMISATTQQAFINAELEHGTGALTIGRLAAGICMLVSTMPASQLEYLRDDLFEDLRFSSLLIGADQDRKLLMEVFHTLERVHRAEAFGLPNCPLLHPPTAEVVEATLTTPKAPRKSPAKKAAKPAPAAKKPTRGRKLG